MGALKSCTAGPAVLEPELSNGHVMLPASALRVGANTIALTFDAGDAPLNRGVDLLYTIFVPARAHEAFPCFDQPDLKARWTVSLDVPDGWNTVANGAEIARTSLGRRTRVTFAETPPLPTYLVAFAAGTLSIEHGQRHGRSFRMFHRHAEASAVLRNRDALFDLHAASLEWLERYTGVPYPFGKFDFVLLPAFQFGGMEHPGAVFYHADHLLLDESATETGHLDRASLIAHETSHMWFGGLVTMTWFDDVWMKEIFATFMAGKIVDRLFPDVNHDLRFLHAHHHAAYDVDRTAGSHSIRQPLANLADAGALYDAIIYHKAPIVIRQLEQLMGAGKFRDAVEAYLQGHAFGNAAWPDLLRVINAAAPLDLTEWSRAWIDQPGRPHVATRLTIDDTRISTLAFTTDDRRGPSVMWTQQLNVALGYRDRVELLAARLDGERSEIDAAAGYPEPDFVLPNGDGLGYGAFRLDPRSLTYLARHLADIADPLTRASAWLTLWDSMLAGDLPAGTLLDLALAALPRETNELNVARILSDLERLYWIFTDEPGRSLRAGAVDGLLRAGVASAATSTLKHTWFDALLALGSIPETTDWLTRLWLGDDDGSGLTLVERDLIALAQALAVRNAPSSSTILEQQIARTVDPDRRAALRFVAPALSADEAERRRFFASLADADNRRHERWVVDGLRCLHHPMRAASAVEFLEPGLEWLETIRRTGDIFFPARWIGATLSGHASPAAASIVHGFLDRAPPGYPGCLRRIILISADYLFRATASNAGKLRG